VSEREFDSLPERPQPAGVPAPAAPVLAGLGSVAGAMGNRGFASAVLARRPAGGAIVARDPGADPGPPPVSPAVRALADTRIAPELRAVGAELRAAPPPAIEHLRTLRTRVATVRGLFDTVQPEGETAAQNWGGAMVQTVLARTLLDGLLFPGSDAGLRLAWGKTLGTCRQLVGLLRAADVETPPAPEATPAPSPNALPPPPPPPIGSEPQLPAAAPAKPADVMEFDICPRIEQAIGEIAHLVEAATTEELEAARDRLSDLPDKIYETASGQEFGPVAALEFQKGLELINQATLPPPDQLTDIAEKVESAADRVTNLEGAGDEPPPAATAAPGFNPAPSPNELPPPPPPPPP
jgi:hypothetical protein